MAILAKKILLEIFHCEVVLQLECSFYSRIDFHKANLTLNMGDSVAEK